jgi:two-component system, cell cycle sensor histidine kinase and response regulator CckA
MNDRKKTKDILIGELAEMRRRLTALEESPRGHEKTEEALRESENKFRDLVEKSLVGVYLIQDGVFTYVNPKFAGIFGYTTGELTAKKGRGPVILPKDLVLREDWLTVNENIRKRITGETESIHSEFRGIMKSGEIRCVEVYGSRTTYQGRPALIGTLLDITERKKVEELLKRAEQKYRGIFENAVEGVFQTTPEGRVIAANPALAKMLGYESPEELVASLTDIMHQLYVDPERRSELVVLLETQGTAFGFECPFYKKDGSTIWVSMNARHVRGADGSTLFYEGTLKDITEKKKVENQLRLLNEFNRAIIDNAPVAIFTLDKNGVITSVNHGMASLSGLGPRAGEKLVGFNWLRNPLTIQCGLAGHIEAGLRGEPFQLWDFPFMSYRGDRNIFMDFKGVPLKGKSEDIEGLLCIIEETTERVNTRAKLMQEAKMSAIGRLAAGIAHELNNPLGTLVAYSERACNYLESFRDRSAEPWELDKLRGYLEIVEEEAFRCKGVTADILSLPRREGLEITEIDINRLLESVIKSLNVERLNVKIRKEMIPALPRVPGDISTLRQVFVNLIQNGMDAAEGRTNATIWVRTRANENGVLVEIEDNGTGIPESIIDKIFEPFFTTKEAKGGTGLGLSLCYDFLKDMGGALKVESKPGYGTTVFVTLPGQNKEKRRAGQE